MKKIRVFLMACTILFCCGLHSLAAEETAFSELRLYDGAGLFTEDEEALLSDSLFALREETGADAAIVTLYGMPGTDMWDSADLIYAELSMGTGESRAGSLLLIDMESRQVYLFANGEENRYLTDSALSWLVDEEILPLMAEEEYFEAAEQYAEGVSYLHSLGIASDQYTVHTDTGAVDYYLPKKKRGLSLWDGLLAAAVSAGVAVLPCISTKKKYAMEKEKEAAARFHLAYQANARFLFDEKEGEAVLKNKFVTTARVPRTTGYGGGFGGRFGGRFGSGSSVGGGRSGYSGGRGGRF